VLAFAVGVAIPMLFIALLGRQFILKIKLAKKASIIRKSLGILIILSVFLLIYSPNLFLVSTVNQNNVASNANLSFETGYMAPPIQGTAWINSPPLNLANLKNKVILIDFWTYSCINCIRTLPYLKNWYQKYRDKGLIIIGVHSPEFAFEHDLNNVIKAVKKYDITYPVVLDNNFQTWQNYQNQFWPAHYLIDRTGKVVYQHAGEGEYAVTENNIRHLLGLAPTNPSQKEARQSEPLSPEMYFGFERAREFTSPETPAIDKSQTYSYPTDITRNRWALKGMWVMTLHNIISGGQGASIKVAFHASQVFAVMGNQAKPVVVKVLLNGKIVHDNAGDDVMNGQVVVNSSRLYHLVRLPADADGVLELIASAPGLEMYTFTFGGK
jgi:thiol-disulfide isomerase/thioredoxin